MKFILTFILAIVMSCGFAASYQDYINNGEMELRVDSDGWLWGPPVGDGNSTGIIAIPVSPDEVHIVIFSQNQYGDQVWSVVFGNETHLVGSISQGPTVLPVSMEDLESFAINGFSAASLNGNVLEVPADYVRHWIKSLIEFQLEMKKQINRSNI